MFIYTMQINFEPEVAFEDGLYCPITWITLI